MLAIYALAIVFFLFATHASYRWLRPVSADVSEKVDHSYIKNGQEERLIDVPKKKYCLTMGLRKSSSDKWLTVDGNYLREHEIKSRLLKNYRNRILGCLPEAETACEEVLEAVVADLTQNYPASFKRITDPIVGDAVEIVQTGETFPICAPYGHMMPLEIAARLAMEDFNVLLKDDSDQHTLSASATCYPVGWSVDHRLGWPLHKVHGPVPLWKDSLNSHVEHFLSRISPSHHMERRPVMFQVADLRGDLAAILCQLDAFNYDTKPAGPEEIIIRAERQTFRRLPKSNAVLFAVKTTLCRLTDLSHAELEKMINDAKSWPDQMAQYKGKHCWWDCAMRYYESVSCRSRFNSDA